LREINEKTRIGKKKIGKKGKQERERGGNREKGS
jgi:hypothetical protein